MPTPLLLLVVCFFTVPCFGAGHAFRDTGSLEALVYRGAEYTKIISSKSGTPFIYEDSSGEGKIRFQGNWFTIPDLRYDAEDDVLMVFHRTVGLRISLVKEKIDEFVVAKRRFIRMEDKGFFEVVYGGQHTVLVKWQKILTRIGVEEPIYRTYRNVYIVSGGQMTEVSNRKDIFKALGTADREKLSAFKTTQLNFKKDLPGSAAAMMRWVDGEGHD